MQTLLLQDWVSLSSTVQWPTGSGVLRVVQSEPEWMRARGFSDATFYIDIQHATGTGLSLSMETAPCAQESLFVAMTAPLVLAGLSGTTQIVNAFAHATTGPPLSEVVRWSISATASWEACFRITMLVS